MALTAASAHGALFIASRDSYYRRQYRDSVKEYTEYTYPNANYGFHNDTTPRHDKDAAALAWQRTLDFFEKNLT